MNFARSSAGKLVGAYIKVKILCEKQDQLSSLFEPPFVFEKIVSKQDVVWDGMYGWISLPPDTILADKNEFLVPLRGTFRIGVFEYGAVVSTVLHFQLTE